ncbi:MAG: HEAT repeat domain-containing protein [bacterium]|nr:HEAT repeat domain-containing protein [bacterium]
MTEHGTASWLATVLLVGCAAVMMPSASATMGVDVYVWERAPELQATLASVRKCGELTPSDAERLLSYLNMRDGELAAAVAFIVGESQGYDIALCDVLAGRFEPEGFAQGYATVALLKKESRWKSDSGKVKAFRALLADPNPYARIEAAKEIARIDIDQGMEVLERLAQTDEDDLVQSAAARALYEMGGPDLEGKRWALMGFARYMQLVDIIEGRCFMEYDMVWEKLPKELSQILSEVRETRQISESQVDALKGWIQHSDHVLPRVRLVASAAVFAHLEEPNPSLRKELEQAVGEARADSLPYAFVRMALLKDEFRDKPITEKVEALEPLTKDVNWYLRAEAAKEIARIDPDRGKVLLRRLLDTDKSLTVQGESARFLDKMGEPTPFGAAHRHRWDSNSYYTAILKSVEGEPLW